jgi:hypothetical protein
LLSRQRRQPLRQGRNQEGRGEDDGDNEEESFVLLPAAAPVARVEGATQTITPPTATKRLDYKSSSSPALPLLTNTASTTAEAAPHSQHTTRHDVRRAVGLYCTSRSAAAAFLFAPTKFTSTTTAIRGSRWTLYCGATFFSLEYLLSMDGKDHRQRKPLSPVEHDMLDLYHAWQVMVRQLHLAGETTASRASRGSRGHIGLF